MMRSILGFLFAFLVLLILSPLVMLWLPIYGVVVAIQLWCDNGGPAGE